MKWKSIKDAPKDGTRFVGGYYHKIYGWLWDSCRFYDEDKHGNREPYVVMDNGGNPTHFLILPEPPEKQENSNV